MKNIILSGLGLLATLAAWATYPAGYYNALDGKTGVELKKTAKQIVRNHTVISYGDKTWDAFETTDIMMVNGKAAWWDMYSDNVVYVSTGHGGLNIEHSVANSWWGKTKNDAYKDLFHLNPSDATANNRKANYPLGEIRDGGVYWDNGVTFVGTAVSGQGGGAQRVFEPKDCYKGDFARAFMYIFTVYDDIAWKSNTAWMYEYPVTDLGFQKWASDLLLKWNDADPVDEKESNRNEAIYKIQHNRNPYIDLQDLCHYIWGSKSGTPYKPGDNPVGPGPDDPSAVTELDCNFEAGSDLAYYQELGWTNYVSAGSLKGWFIKNFDGNNYMSATAYTGTADGGPYEYWLITPALDIKEGGDATLTFRTQGAYGCDGSSLAVFVMDAANPELCTPIELNAAICTPQPDGAKPVYSDWVSSGSVSLADYPGTRFVGFRYRSEKGGKGNSATYCLDDVKVSQKETSADGIAEPALMLARGENGGVRILSSDPVDNVAVYDMTGRLVICIDAAGEDFIALPAGLYIVNAPGRTPAKVVVR